MIFSEKSNDKNTDLIKVAALLIHAAKIDENYSDQEEKIIKKTLLELGTKKENLENIMINAKKIEDNANQILDFTREIKNMKQENKIKMYDLGVRFGKALQMINILRDIPEDLRFGRCYIPVDSLAEFDLEPQDLLDPKNMDKFRPIYNKNLDIASSHLDAAAEYIGMLPYSQFRLRAACMLPVLIGQRTLTLLRTSNVLDETNRVKVLRPEIKRLRNQTLRALVIPGGCQRLLRKNRGI